MNDQSLTDAIDAATDPESGRVAALPGLADQAVETLLTFEQVLEQARRVERTARICVAGDLVDAHDRALEELAELVDPEGNVLSEGDAALADQTRAAELQERISGLRKQMAAKMFAVKFRAVPDDEFEAFEKAHRAGNGDLKDPKRYADELISKCAVEPTLTVAQVQQLRATLGANQMRDLFAKAYQANTAGGLDIPKLPSFLVGPKPPESAAS